MSPVLDYDRLPRAEEPLPDEEFGMDTNGTGMLASLLMCVGVVMVLLLVWGVLAFLIEVA
jgi:hypothetical protein